MTFTKGDLLEAVATQNIANMLKEVMIKRGIKVPDRLMGHADLLRTVMDTGDFMSFKDSNNEDIDHGFTVVGRDDNSIYVEVCKMSGGLKTDIETISFPLK